MRYLQGSDNVHAHSLTWLTGTLNVTKPALTSSALVTLVLFLLWQVRLCAVKRAYFLPSSLVKRISVLPPALQISCTEFCQMEASSPWLNNKKKQLKLYSCTSVCFYLWEQKGSNNVLVIPSLYKAVWLNKAGTAEALFERFLISFVIT